MSSTDKVAQERAERLAEILHRPSGIKYETGSRFAKNLAEIFSAWRTADLEEGRRGIDPFEGGV